MKKLLLLSLLFSLPYSALQAVKGGPAFARNSAMADQQLFKATQSNSLSAAKKAIAAGADVNGLDRAGSTSLCQAVLHRNKAMVELLLKNGASVDLPDVRDNTALYLAVKDRYPQDQDAVELVSLLIEKGADANAKTDTGNTPLHVAILRPSRAIARLLVENSADVHAKNDAGKTPLDLARACNMYQGSSEEFMKDLMDDRDNAKENGQLFEAVLTNNISAAKKALIAGADINSMDKAGLTPLCKSVIQRNRIMTELLLRNGANVDATTAHKNTPLYLAVRDRYPQDKDAVELVTLLIKYGADVNAQMDDGSTPLHAAVLRSNPIIARLLIENGADLNMKNKEGKTPLNLARSRHKYDTDPEAFMKVMNNAKSTFSHKRPRFQAKSMPAPHKKTYFVD